MTENISRRDHFAVLILAGMWSNSNVTTDYTDIDNPDLPELAIAQADELIKQLDRRDRVKTSEAYWNDREAKEDA